MVVEKKVILLHIAGTGRNGSTLMESILNEIPGFFAAGELGFGDIFNEKSKCFCGEKFSECPCWKDILNELINLKEIDKSLFLKAQTKYKSIFQLIKLLFLMNPHKLQKDFRLYLQYLEKLYHTIAKYRVCKVITDSSASFAYGYHLSQLSSVDLYVVHLVRDPRGYVHSMNRIKMNSKNEPWSGKTSILKAAFTWLKKNLIVEFFFAKRKGKYLRIHYEEFIQNPFESLEEIGKMMGIELGDHLHHLIDGKKFILGVHHISRGNIDFFRRRRENIVLRTNERWKEEMSKKNIFWVNLITWPLRLRYTLSRKK